MWPKVGPMFLRSAARIRKIIISNRADRPRLKMSSPRRLVGQTLSSIISAPSSTLWDSSSLSRASRGAPRGASSPQRLSKLVRQTRIFATARGILWTALCVDDTALSSILVFAQARRFEGSIDIAREEARAISRDSPRSQNAITSTILLSTLA